MAMASASRALLLIRRRPKATLNPPPSVPADLVDEVVLQFTARPGVKVKIAIEIQVDSATGFDDGLQRAVKENCNVLRFKNAEFEE